MIDTTDNLTDEEMEEGANIAMDLSDMMLMLCSKQRIASVLTAISIATSKLLCLAEDQKKAHQGAKIMNDSVTCLIEDHFNNGNRTLQ